MEKVDGKYSFEKFNFFFPTRTALENIVSTNEFQCLGSRFVESTLLEKCKQKYL